MTTGDPIPCPHCGSIKGRMHIDTHPGYIACMACDKKIEEKTFAVPLPSPPAICPGCGRPATWRYADDHPETCWQCGSCGEHYSRQRQSIHIPLGMTRDVAEALLAEGPYERLNAPTDAEAEAAIKELFDKLGETLTEDLTELFIGKARRPAYMPMVNARDCRWCDPQADQDPLELGLCGPHANNLLDERKKGLRSENDALGVLWGFIDSVSSAPRMGNVFERAREVLPYVDVIKDQNKKLKLENTEFLGRLKDAREELKVLRNHATREHVEMANAEISEIRSKVNPE